MKAGPLGLEGYLLAHARFILPLVFPRLSFAIHRLPTLAGQVMGGMMPACHKASRIIMRKKRKPRV
jgi:hypothetical protein